MRVKVKICGITEIESALAAVEAGADALGFVFASSKRKVDRQTVRNICASLPAMVYRVGVFVNSTAAEIKETIQECGLDGVQLHGDESPDFARQLLPRGVIKSIAVQDKSSLEKAHLYRHCTLLLDACSPGQRGGSGRAFNWSLLEGFPVREQTILAGGLNPSNVYAALEQVRPRGVDVSSGVESGNGKDPDKIKEFIQEIRRWENHASR